MKGQASIRPNLLIVGSLSDAHVQAVCERLPCACVPLVLDYSKYLATFSATLQYGSTQSAGIQWGLGQYCTFVAIEKVWWRRPLAFNFPESCSSDRRLFLSYQYEFFWTSFLSSLPLTATWYNDWRSDYAADRNAAQLVVARECGLTVPETIITDEMQDALQFIDRHVRTIVKSFAGSVAHWEPTKIAKKDAILDAWRATRFPIILQEYIDGRFDYRVTIVDDFCAAVEFDTGSSSYLYDVRVDTTSACRPVKLEASVMDALRAVLKRYQLRFGAFDLRRRNDGEIIFLELNPAGQFLYIDQRAGTDIVGAMAKALSPSEPAI